MRPVLFIDCWPEVARPGDWKRRFIAVPRLARDCGRRADVVHFTRLDLRALRRQPPAGIILSGSRSNLVDDPASDPRDGVRLSAFRRVAILLRDLPDLPVLGICFGMQLLAVLAGGSLRRLPAPRSHPDWPITVVRPDPLFAGWMRPRVVENHAWAVDQPGAGYRIVARSADGIEAMRHRQLPRAGVQFHPEYAFRPGARAASADVLCRWFAGLD
jgi:GMP synthase-like glutamine amidotransferase